MFKKNYDTEIEFMRDFYDTLKEQIKENNEDPSKTKIKSFDEVDYSCSTDGRLVIDGYLCSLNEMKLVSKTPNEVFKQMKKYVDWFNNRAIPLPKYGVYISYSPKQYQVFDLESNDFDNAKVTEAKSWETPLDCYAYMQKNMIQQGWINYDSLKAYSDRFFENGNLKIKINGRRQDISKKINGKTEISETVDKACKEEFICEIRKENNILNVKPFIWDECGEAERRLLDVIGPKSLQKQLGAFFTPKAYAQKAAEYVKNVVANLDLKTEDYLIIDRCAGTGALEESFSNEMLEHTVLNTIVEAESASLHGMYGDRVLAILPENTSTNVNGLFVNGNALEKPFNDELTEFIEGYRATCEEDGKALRLIFFENPPYAEPGAKRQQDNGKGNKTAGTYIHRLIKQTDIKGRGKTDLANQFIWSAFNLYDCDHYIVFSPIKYWKSQYIIDEKFIEGFIANRKYFHAGEAGISVIHWENMHGNITNEELELEAYDIENNFLIKKDNKIVKKIHNKINDIDFVSQTKKEYICESATKSGTPNYLNGMLTNYKVDKNAHVVKMGIDNIRQAIPLFVANCYTCKDFTETEIIMKSGDGGLAYMQDEQFLNDCFIWAGLSDVNKCESTTTVRNEYCFCQNTKADEIVSRDALDIDQRYASLFRRWRKILEEVAKTDEKRDYPYGLNQIEKDLASITVNATHEDGSYIYDKTGTIKTIKKYEVLCDEISQFKQELKDFYNTNITPKLFKEYELLK